MNKLFKPRCLRRIFLCLALMFPIVYLCGGLFFALAGAHGTQLFTNGIDENEKVEVSLSYTPNTWLNASGDVVPQSNSLTFSYIVVNNVNASYFFNVDPLLTSYEFRICYYQDNQWVSQIRRDNETLPIEFSILNGCNGFRISIYSGYFDNSYDNFNFSLSYTYDEIDEYLTAKDYSEYLFSQPFANDNFITSLGKDLVNGSNKGFVPMNSLFNFVNSNVFHFDASDNLAMFGFGYVYYAVNVLIIYEILVLAVKLIMLPLKAVDVFDKEDI